METAIDSKGRQSYTITCMMAEEISITTGNWLKMNLILTAQRLTPSAKPKPNKLTGYIFNLEAEGHEFNFYILFHF